MSRAAFRVTVAGGGIAGLAVAFALVERGAKVRLLDPGGRPSASAVAAGMVAPALEALFDPLSASRFELLSGAGELWPGFLSRGGLVGVWTRSGALLAASNNEATTLEALADRLALIGAKAERLDGAALRASFPDLSDQVRTGVLVEDEARVEPQPLLEALRAVLVARGVEIVPERLSQAAALEGADWLVIAAGAGGTELTALAPELAALQPIRGQILAFAPGAGPAGGPTLRSVSGAYLAPLASGVLAGGTMEPGRLDLEPDPAVAERLRGQAAALVPALAGAPGSPRVGVRASTPDGLPLVGPSSTDRVLLATGMRRNGWLLAPLAAEVIASQIFGTRAPAAAALFDPGRFGD